MSANTRQETLARLAILFTAAVDLINKDGRESYKTEELLNALQGYKDDKLGWVEPKLSSADHLRIFYGAIRDDRERYLHLMDSLREFGVNKETIQKLKSSKAETLLKLWQTPLQAIDDFPYESAVSNAFRQIQKKVGIKNPINFPTTDFKELKRLYRDCEELAFPL